jgi:hypothetical protein
MALPATYDINYYRGDSYEFIINAKDIDGTELDLSAYTALFTIASERGPSPSFSTAATATIDGSQIICTISPTVGATLTSGPYVYDVQVKQGSSNVYTYLTGSINVTLDVSEA